MIYQIIQKW